MFSRTASVISMTLANLITKIQFFCQTVNSWKNRGGVTPEAEAA